ncbi:MAG TPA: 3-oxoacyl-[acyl-carrier-protein] synthase III C-terminal domain-containing protein [Steroidobacter sp.]|nr:3-oxoacyl-[acyl-carrier-protein] synthase III C-terminal domain-containing protein [Steroidobacter sp.]
MGELTRRRNTSFTHSLPRCTLHREKSGLVPHQANKRILDHVAQDLALPAERLALTIDTLGNTGCASVAITLHRYADRVAPGEYAVLATFGGGYSVGAALLRRIGSG